MHFNELTPAEAERLALLAEELGETTHAIGKILRHGYESKNPYHPTGQTNREALEKEVADVYVAVRMMFEAGDIRRMACAMHEDVKTELEIEMGRREPINNSFEQMQKAYREEMMNRAGPAMTMRPLVDKEMYYIEETISALRKIEDSDCTGDVWETIQAAIEDLEQCV